jgi:hypothetical protein
MGVPMPEYVRADKQLLVAALGIISSLIIGLTLGLIEVYYGYAIYSWMFWFVIPVGAFLAGFGAASGYYAGAMLFHQKPAGGVLFNMVAASLSAFFIVHYIPYYMFEVDGIRVKEALSFWQYFDIDVRNTSLSLVRGGASTGELGSFWGYAYAGLQLLGFSVGGFAVFGWLSQNPYCEKCSRYLKKTGKQERFTSGGKTLNEHINKKANELLDQAIDKPEVALKAMAEIRNQLRLQLEIFQTFYDMKAVQAFQNEVLTTIAEVDEDVRGKIIRKLHERRAIRSSIRFD